MQTDSLVETMFHARKCQNNVLPLDENHQAALHQAPARLLVPTLPNLPELGSLRPPKPATIDIKMCC